MVSLSSEDARVIFQSITAIVSSLQTLYLVSKALRARDARWTPAYIW